jgi:hypothetical protein
MGWSLQYITKWSGHAHEPIHMDPKMGKKNLKISRTETGRVKKNYGFIMLRGTFLSFAKLNFL